MSLYKSIITEHDDFLAVDVGSEGIKVRIFYDDDLTGPDSPVRLYVEIGGRFYALNLLTEEEADTLKENGQMDSFLKFVRDQVSWLLKSTTHVSVGIGYNEFLKWEYDD